MKAKNLTLMVVNEIENGKFEIKEFKPYKSYESFVGCILGDAEILRPTGLKDKNNKEIYEGDIIEGGYLNPLTGDFTSKRYIVKYEKASFIGELIGHSPYGNTWLNFIHGEIIGNIYESPELLAK